MSIKIGKQAAFGLVLLAVLGCLAGCGTNQPPAADFVLVNGFIYTADPAQPRAQAAAVREGKFVFVGNSGEARRYAGEKTRVLDLGGRTVLPGFIDSHAHPTGALEQFFSAALFGLKTVREYQETVRLYAEKNPVAEVIRGSGWSNTLFPKTGPDRALLDEVVRDRPVALDSEDGHSLWVNTEMLERAGITRDTPDPPGGVIERDPKTGLPTGTLRETAAGLVGKLMPEPGPEELARGLEAYQTMALAFGITTVHEASIGPGSPSRQAYRLLEERGRLRMRFRASLDVDPSKGLGQIGALAAEREASRGALFRAAAAKIFVDGVVEGSTAFLKEPYAHLPGSRGIPLWTQENLDAMCAELDQKGFQLHFHAIGDAAAASALDSLERAARRNGRRDSRHMITHLQLVSAGDILRFRDLGVVAVPQPYWFMKDDYYRNLQVPYLGEKRADEEYPMESFFRAGVVVASSSDYPVTIPCNPLVAIQVGMTRSSPESEGPGDVLWPVERATLDEMLASFTRNGAFANFLEKETGSIETGKWADLIVLDRNLFEIPATEISRIRVLLTLFQGREAYRHPDFTGSRP